MAAADGRGGRWNPWAELRARPGIVFRLDPVAGLLGGGLYARRGDQRAIVLDPTLDRRQRRCALAHELVHDERGSGCDHRDAPSTWDAVVAREEAVVDAEAARRLVPAGELLAMALARQGVGDTLEPWQVADEFDVDLVTAERAMRLVQRPAAGADRAAGRDPVTSPP